MAGDGIAVIEVAKLVTKGTLALFSSAAFDQNTARINQVATYGLDIFATSYKTSADTLVRCVLEQGADPDTLVYPIVFCIDTTWNCDLKRSSAKVHCCWTRNVISKRSILYLNTGAL